MVVWAKTAPISEIYEELVFSTSFFMLMERECLRCIIMLHKKYLLKNGLRKLAWTERHSLSE